MAINDRALAQQFLTDALGLDYFPYVGMGNIDSLDLFGVNELILFAFYAQNKKRYHNALDIGANLGLHSLLMQRAGWNVKAYEPDPEHYARFIKNLQMNCNYSGSRQDQYGVHPWIKPHNAAVHTADGYPTFVRVLDNLTGNHLEGCKDSYGPIERVTVKCLDCRPIFDWADFAKIDCEGNEVALIETLTHAQMQHLDIMVEVRDEHNASKIGVHCDYLNVPMWSQKIKWQRVKSVVDIPRSHHEGSLFIGHNPPFA